MKSLLNGFFWLAGKIEAGQDDDNLLREKRLAEVKSLLAEIAVPPRKAAPTVIAMSGRAVAKPSSLAAPNRLSA